MDIHVYELWLLTANDPSINCKYLKVTESVFMFISYNTVRDSFIHTYVVSQEVTYVTATMNTTCSVCDMMSVTNVSYPVLFMCVGNAVCGSNLTRRCSSDGRGGRNCLRERRYIS